VAVPLESKVGSAKKDFSAWQAPFLAFYSRAFYADVATKWKGTGIAYMLALSTVVWAVTITCTAVIPCWRLMNNPALTGFLQQVPTVTFAGGRLSINKPCPYRIGDGKGVTWLVFKTDKEGCELADDDPPIVVTKEAVFLTSSSSKNRCEKYELKAISKVIDHFEFDGMNTLSTIKLGLTWLPLVAFIVGWPVVILGHLGQMIVYAAVAMLLAHFWKKRSISFPTGLRVAAMAITPNVMLCTLFTVLCVFLLPFRLLDAFVDYAPINSYAFHHIFDLASVGLAVAYVFLAVHSLQLSEEAIEHEFPHE
jgi:hypothetical protein